MAEDKRQRLGMFAAQQLSQHPGTHSLQFPERHRSGFKLKGIHDVFGGFPVQVGHKQTLGGVFSSGYHIHARDERLMELAQNRLDLLTGHGGQIHNGLGNGGNFLTVHALEHVRRELVAQGEQKNRYFLRAFEIHACHSLNCISRRGFCRPYRARR